MDIKVYKTKIPKPELDALAQMTYGDMVKGVVDIENNIIALGGDLHADCEQVLLDQGSKQSYLWGFNIYPDRLKNDRVEYTSLINIRPRQGNFQIEVKDERLRRQMMAIIDTLVD